MKSNKFCSCGKLIPVGDNCSCRPIKSNAAAKSVNSTTRFQKLRMRIIDRDDYKCVRCFIKFNEETMRELECHHIKSQRDFPELAYEETNLITVCRSCNLDLGTSNRLDFPWEPKELPVPAL